jgi:hypothetical protein
MLSRLPTFALGLLLVWTAVAGDASAQTIRGRLIDDSNDRPVAGGIVIVSVGDSLLVSTLSDGQGRFDLRLEGRGSFDLKAVRMGYQEVMVPGLTVQDEADLDFDLLMIPHAVVLEGLTVTAQRYQSDLQRLGLREESLAGRILTRDDLARRGARDIGDILIWGMPADARVIRSENVWSETGDRPLEFCVTFARARRTGEGQCALIVIDQQVVPQHMVATLHPDELEAIVMLSPIEARAQFGPLARGGAVLLYRREGGVH